MPTISEHHDKLEAFKRELEAGGQMSDKPETLVGAVELTGAQIDADGLAWIEVMPTAEKARNGDWYFTITADDLNAAAEYIKANPERIPIDYDHAGMSDGGSTRAAGWFTGNAEIREGSLWAEVKWTPRAVEEIRGGDFRFVSPEWTMSEKDTKTGLMTKLRELAAATLTNRPFFKEMAPVTARLIESEQLDALADQYGAEISDLLVAAQGDDDEKFTAAITAALAAGGNPSAADQGENDNTKESTVAEETPQVTDYMKALGIPADADPKHKLAAAFRDKDEQILRLTQEVTELSAAATLKDTQAQELASRLEDLEKKDRARDIEVILARAVEKGRVLPAEKETLAEVFAGDVDGLRKMIATRPAEMFNLEAKGASVSEPDRFADDADVVQFVKTLNTAGDPVDTEGAKQHLAAMQLLAEQGKEHTYTNDEYIAAFNQAEKLVY